MTTVPLAFGRGELAALGNVGIRAIVAHPNDRRFA